MVIGSGLIGKKFEQCENEDLLIFASGVSNSKLNDENELLRERNLIASALVNNPGRIFVYFSTYSINDPVVKNNLYVSHKLNMESFIRENSSRYLIVRTSNIVGPNSSNPHTIINYLVNHIKELSSFELWKNSYRNILDIDHLYAMVLKVVELNMLNQTLYLLNPVSLNMVDIVETVESFLQIKANYKVLDIGSYFEVDKSLSMQLFKALNIGQDDYLLRTLKKYY
jgi:dTDP-4-dehydrorhamnose reductase